MNRIHRVGIEGELVGALCLIMIISLGTMGWFSTGWAAGEPGKESGGGDCFQCHQGLKEKFSNGYAHQAADQGRCTGCHNPHAAKFDHLLVNRGATLCFKCHKGAEKEWMQMKYIHGPLKSGECLDCHEAHVSLHQHHLKEEGGRLCFGCHEKAAFSRGFVHEPVKEGNCQACHLTHASSRDHLLLGDTEDLCLSCHGQKDLTKVHDGYKVKGSQCTVCHNPHSSESKGLLYANIHQPFKEKKCRQCHQQEGTPKATVVANGGELCYTCHQKKREEFQSKTRSHLATGSRECTYCHNPHAADRLNFIRAADRSLCLGCHADKESWLEAKGASIQHPEVQKGNCSSCHDPHASSYSMFLRDEAMNLCTKCHTRQKKVCHPVGDKIIDPRGDKKKPIKCDTCHNPMGTDFKYNLRLDGTQELCQQCHQR